MNGKVLTFYLNNRSFGIDITKVEEINRNIQFTPVPTSREYIVGLFNMRGQVVTLFDIGRRLEYRHRGEYKRPTSIILKQNSTDGDLVGFLIDRPGDVIDVKKGECEPLPANVSAVESRFINKIVKRRDELIMLIDTDEIFRHGYEEVQ
ncbi:MAG: chemotaxis protein CheW [Clostridiales bacterium]|nr:chemotaxis protein CheW [Clostridiales bacterium]